MDPTGFVRRDLARAIASLQNESILGPWAKTLKPRHYQGRFRPEFYEEDHAHPHVEMCHLLEGTCALSYRFKRYQLRAGDLGFFPPNTPHAETYLRPAAPYRLAWWILTPDRLVVQATQYAPRSGFRMAERILMNDPGQDARDAGHRLIRMANAKHPPQADRVAEALLSLAAPFLRYLISSPNDERSGAHREVIDHAKSYIDGQPDRSISITEVAEQVLLSPNYLTTLFRAETGVSLGSYIKRRRIDRAKRLLSSTPNSIKEIAYELGFDDPYSFSRTFKRVEGVSPLHYRRTAKA